MSGDKRLRSLYICYLGLSDPLVETQVVAYLEGLAERGHTIHLLTFESERRTKDEEAELAATLRARGIAWHALRYHKRPSLLATIYDTLRGAIRAIRLVRKHRLDVVHARIHVPAAMALMARRLTRCGLIFDIRGLMAEEYVDAGRWKEGGISWRLTKWVERRATAVADACVVLTEPARELLFPDAPTKPVSVIPSCADLERLEAGAAQRNEMRRELGVEGKTVLVYVGKFGGWYLQREMVEFFVAARGEIENLHFLVLSQDDHRHIRDEFDRARIEPHEFTVTALAPERMGAGLAAADLGISFIAALPSKIASSPTKIGEYLGAGLPVIATSGVGAADMLLAGSGTGVLISTPEAAAYGEAARAATELLADPETPARCINVARTELSLREVGIPRYEELYVAVATQRQGD